MKKALRFILWTITTVYITLYALLQTPVVQSYLANMVSGMLQERFATEIKIGKVDIRIPNRIIIDKVEIKDKQKEQLLHIGRLSGTIELLPLFEGRISVSSAQLFGMRANLYKEHEGADINCQFIIDSLKSKDKDSTKKTGIDLRIASLIIRNSSLKYDQRDVPITSEVFQPTHINISNLSSHLILYNLTNDSIHLDLKKLSLKTNFGFELKKLNAEVKVKQNNVDIERMNIALPASLLNIPKLHVSFKDSTKLNHHPPFEVEARIKSEHFNFNDLKAFLPDIAEMLPKPLKFSTFIKGNEQKLNTVLDVNSINNNDISLNITAMLQNILSKTDISSDIILDNLYLSNNIINYIFKKANATPNLQNIGDLSAHGTFKSIGVKDCKIDTDISSAKLGHLKINGSYNDGRILAALNTPRLDLAKIINDNNLGTIACKIDIDARLDKKTKINSAKAKAIVSNLSYKNYQYHNIKVDGIYENDFVEGQISINDPNISLSANGQANLGVHKNIDATFVLNNFAPNALGLIEKYTNDTFGLTATAKASGNTFDNLLGSLSIDNVYIKNDNSPERNSHIDNITLTMENTEDNNRQLTLSSDFAFLRILGEFHTSDLPACFSNILAKHLPACSFLPTYNSKEDNFHIMASVSDLNFIKKFVDIPVDVLQPIDINGRVNAAADSSNILLKAPQISVNGTNIGNININLWSNTNAAHNAISAFVEDDNGHVELKLNCDAKDNSINSTLAWDNLRQNVFKGSIKTSTTFSKTDNTNSDNITINILPSTFEVNDTLWSIHSRNINYNNKELNISKFSIENDSQHLYIDGVASANTTDTLLIEMNNLNVAYILNLVNFHSVEFEGSATGNVTSTGLFSTPKAKADLLIKNFILEKGEMGDFAINASYDHHEGQIDINGNTPTLHVAGNISPERNSIDLKMDLKQTPLGLLEGLCGSVLDDVTLTGNGDLRLHGLLSAINLEGNVSAKGGILLKSTNCRYNLEGDTIRFVPDDILFKETRFTDELGNTATITGGIHHQNLKRLSFDLSASSNRLLAFNYPKLTKGETFCGYAIIDGKIDIHGKGNEVNITADCTPLKDSSITYNASMQESLQSQDFIIWSSANAKKDNTETDTKSDNNNFNTLDIGNDRTNIRLNFLINMTPDAYLHLIMDEVAGDYINLYGSGNLNVQYYNKGSLDIFGNYNVEHGIYKMTIQNIMRRDFSFQKGGTIAFAGNPYDAILNMQAAYTLNNVSLADLSIGSSFKTNSVPVKCLMNISGTPYSPKVDFGLDLPSLSGDARQMVYSLMNSAEEMNQQVLYLLAIGRFYSQNTDADNTGRTKQSTLAMQSFLSGTLSQQLGNVISQLIHNNNWTVGTNIAPGTDGFNDAVYEGILSGRMLNNRLIFNGQFGYRDNITTDTQGFIGDFTLQYLLTPNGNFSIKMYNQANDRYFTKSSLNTQGIGFVIQKEFGKP